MQTTKCSYCHVCASKYIKGFKINSLHRMCCLIFEMVFPLFFHVLYLSKCSIMSVRFWSARSSLLKVLKMFFGKGVLEICSKFTGEHPYRSVISKKLLCNFLEITLRHGCSPINLLRIFRTPFPKNSSEGLLLERIFMLKVFWTKFLQSFHIRCKEIKLKKERQNWVIKLSPNRIILVVLSMCFKWIKTGSPNFRLGQYFAKKSKKEENHNIFFKVHYSLSFLCSNKHAVVSICLQPTANWPFYDKKW